MAIILTDQNFETEVLKSDKPVLVDFWAPWCGPCQMLGPVIEELSKEFVDKVKVAKLNVDENPQTASHYGIMSIPTVTIFKGGGIIDQFIGVRPKEEMVSKINTLLKSLKS